MTAMIIMIAAPAISNVSVEILALGSIIAEGEAVGTITGVAVGTGVGFDVACGVAVGTGLGSLSIAMEVTAVEA